MRTINIRGTVIGEGMPKICVPVLGRNIDEIVSAASGAARSGADMAEFRSDHLENADDPAAVVAAVDEVRGHIGDMPLLFTFRTAAEGGERSVNDGAYLEICRCAIDSGSIDLLDVELAVYERIFSAGLEDLLEYAHKRDVSVVMSNHDFEKTPETEVIERRLRRMDELGADILKIAVMPRCRADVVRLLGATVDISETVDKPLITMSMGSTGLISRLTGGFTGSTVTFASAGRASAPGQIEARKVREVLSAIEAAGVSSGYC